MPIKQDDGTCARMNLVGTLVWKGAVGPGNDRPGEVYLDPRKSMPSSPVLFGAFRDDGLYVNAKIDYCDSMNGDLARCAAERDELKRQLAAMQNGQTSPSSAPVSRNPVSRSGGMGGGSAGSPAVAGTIARDHSVLPTPADFERLERLSFQNAGRMGELFAVIQDCENQPGHTVILDRNTTPRCEPIDGLVTPSVVQVVRKTPVAGTVKAGNLSFGNGMIGIMIVILAAGWLLLKQRRINILARSLRHLRRDLGYAKSRIDRRNYLLEEIADVFKVDLVTKSQGKTKGEIYRRIMDAVRQMVQEHAGEREAARRTIEGDREQLERVQLGRDNALAAQERIANANKSAMDELAAQDKELAAAREELKAAFSALTELGLTIRFTKLAGESGSGGLMKKDVPPAEWVAGATALQARIVELSNPSKKKKRIEAKNDRLARSLELAKEELKRVRAELEQASTTSAPCGHDQRIALLEDKVSGHEARIGLDEKILAAARNARRIVETQIGAAEALVLASRSKKSNPAREALQAIREAVEQLPDSAPTA
ncbi:MAG: hypothetical protein Q7S48_03510 [bacterium]|nr:hypothetical protein [bacterium]